MKMFRYMEDFRSEVNERFEKVATKDSVESLAASVEAPVCH